MSEYQYYEFQAIDRPLTRAEMAEVRALSTRATITPTRFENEYHWGDFKGDPLAMMERYYDAFLYLANWGTHQLMLRLPRSILPPETAARYCVLEESFSMHLTREHVILTFESDEEPDDWEEGDGQLASLVLLRSDITAGDLRSLYLGWLLCVQEEVLEHDLVEPPLPPGLGDLSESLDSLVEFLRIDQDLLEAAAGGPAMPPAIPPSDEARRWLRSLTDAEKDNLLLRLATGDSLPLQAEVRRSIRETTVAKGSSEVTAQGRTVQELLALADRKRQEREQREAQKRELQKQERAAVRGIYLDSLAGREDELWRQVEALVGTKRPSEYPQAVQLLVDLRDLSARQRTSEDFQSRLVDLRVRNGGKRRFLDLLNGAGLQPAQSTLR